MKILNTLEKADKGFYVCYEQAAKETGLDGPSLIYIGPFTTRIEAENHDNGLCKREGIVKV